MVDLSNSGSADSEHRVMDVVADHLDAFIQAWEGSSAPPDIGQFLPADREARLPTLVELIKVDLEYRWLQRNCPKRLSDYLADFPELNGDKIPADLIYEEFHIRTQSGDLVSAEEYLQAFPRQRSEIATMLGLKDAYESTTVIRSRNRPGLEAILVGDTLDDFLLESELGAGAFARVFLARQKSMERLVAVKVSADETNEPKTLAQLDHENIVRVFDQRTLADRKLRLLYMQYVAGGTLQAVIKRVKQTPPHERDGLLLLEVVDAAIDPKRVSAQPTISPTRNWLASATWPETVCWLGAKLARALDYAHKTGVLHRDIKPANVLLTPEAVPKLADFNISFSAKLTGATAEDYLGGSLAYMSPEQLEACNARHPRTAEELDGRSDLFSLGVLLFELLTGARPFADGESAGSGSSLLDEMAQRRRAGGDFSKVKEVPDCPTGLLSVLQKALEPEPEMRFTRGKEMALRLELCTVPKVCDLLFPPRKGARIRLREFSFAVILAAFLVPTLLVAGLSGAVSRSPDRPDFHGVPFGEVEAGLFGIGTLAGITFLCYLALPIARGLRRANLGNLPAQIVGNLRRRALWLGQLAAAALTGQWLVGALVCFVLGSVGRADLPGGAVARLLLLSLACGLVASAYPFFFLTSFSLRSIYPVFLLNDLEAANEDAPLLKRIGRWNSRYLLVAAMAPVWSLGLFLIDKALVRDLLTRPAEVALGIAAGLTLLMLLPCFWLYQLIQADIETLDTIAVTNQRSRKVPRRR